MTNWRPRASSSARPRRAAAACVSGSAARTRRRVDHVGNACCHLRQVCRERAMIRLSMTFEQAAHDVQLLLERPDNDTLLRLYALYKQGSEGDVNVERP